MAQPYRHLDIALIRVTTYGEADLPPWPGGQWRDWIVQVWAHPCVAAAVTLASPVLAERVEALRAGREMADGRLRRMALSLAGYLVRMRGRATPFGLFAGVAPLRFGGAAECRLGEPVTRTSPDGLWLDGLIARLEAAMPARLPVMVNDLAHVRGDRLVVPWRPEADEVSVRYGPAVRKLVELAGAPILTADLLDALTEAFPGASGAALGKMVAELVACGVLITGLRPPSTGPDALTHLIGHVPEGPAARELREIQAALAAADRLRGEGAARARQAVAARMRALHPAEDAQPLRVDLRLDGSVTLPAQVAAEVEAAAGALLRLTPHPAGHPAWQDYHLAFLERYGEGAVVPIGQLIDPATGLGFPAHYRKPWEPGPLTHRDRRLLALAQQAALDGAREVVLDDAAIDDLAAGHEPRALPYLELVAEVRADLSLEVLAADGTAGGLMGRFAGLLPGEAGLDARLPVAVRGAVKAQLSFPPRHPRAHDLARTPLLLPELISVAEHRARPGIPWRELAVTADRDRMYVLRPDRRQVVEPALTSAVAREAMPPVARLLFELPRARGAVVSPFSWGAAAGLPYLPRVRYGRAVLAPARWHVTLPGPRAAGPEWARALRDLRERLRLPAIVSVGAADRRLRLDLDEPMSLALLRAHLGRAGSAVVAEASSPAELFGGRAHEIVVPLAATAPPARAPVIGPLFSPAHAVPPGADVVYAKLYGHPAVVDTILTRHLPELLRTWEDGPPMWWFVRYRDPRPHLRLRLHLTGARAYGPAAARLGTWAAGLRERGLIGDVVLDTYHPETARYGPGEALAAAHAAFAADSAAALAQVATLSAARRVHPHALTAASLADLAAALLGGRAEGARWLIRHPEPGPAPAGGRALARQVLELTGENAPANLPGGTELAAAWRDRRRAVAAYTGLVGARSPVIDSFLHLHHLRALGIDPGAEHTCRRLARAAALSFTARR
ncbi:lantibiotic dehydratase [Nonomuraea typhae]|uniref:lantibiotic dehydratase n=1 Tax=Nonomuraea typhae TaxID=2603600 RepID=UPI001FE425AE|nr:lantibiotic dehydratase [Nonomuraea typhae]